MIEVLTRQLLEDVECLIAYLETNKESMTHDLLGIDVANRVCKMTIAVHGKCEMICRELIACKHVNENSIRLAVGRISAFVFFDVDEFVYSKFPNMAPRGLMKEGVPKSTNLGREINIEALKRLLENAICKLRVAIN